MASVVDVLSNHRTNFQVSFKADKEDFAEVTGDRTPLDIAAGLLKVDREGLESALTSSSSRAGGETITRRFAPVTAEETRDALSRALYSRLFGWLVSCCNDNLSKGAAEASGGDQPSHGSLLTLGILDIFGFENFQVNSLEQLCINVTNEQLQHFFTAFIFEAEQRAYADEGGECCALFPIGESTS
jgi:myosin-3